MLSIIYNIRHIIVVLILSLFCITSNLSHDSIASKKNVSSESVEPSQKVILTKKSHQKLRSYFLKLLLLGSMTLVGILCYIVVRNKQDSRETDLPSKNKRLDHDSIKSIQEPTLQVNLSKGNEQSLQGVYPFNEINISGQKEKINKVVKKSASTEKNQELKEKVSNHIEESSSKEGAQNNRKKDHTSYSSSKNRLEYKNQFNSTKSHKMVGFSWSNNNCFLNASMQLLVNIISNTAKGGEHTIINWQKDFQDNRSSKARVTKAFSKLVEAVAKERIKEHPNAIGKEIRDLRKALKEVTEDLGAGQSDLVLAMTTTLQAIEETLKGDDLFFQEELYIYPNALANIKEIELLTTLLQQKVSKKENLISELFDSTIVETLQCAECGFTHLLVKKQREFKLPVIRMNQADQCINTLEESLESLQQSQVYLKESFPFKCHYENKKSDRIIHKKKILIPPNILLLQLDRYNHSKTDKYTHQISYPQDNLKVRNTLYTLVGIGVHLGDSESVAHYISFVKDLRTNKWWELNDSSVQIADIRYVKDVSKYPSSFGTPTPTLFIYQRKGFCNLGDISSTPKQIGLPLFEGSLYRLSLDKKGEKWVQDKSSFEKLWREIRNKIKNSKNLLILLKGDIYIAFKKSLEAISSQLENDYPKLPKIVEGKIKELNERPKAKNQTGIDVVSSELKGWKDIQEVIKEYENINWKLYYKLFPKFVNKFLKKVEKKSLQEHSVLLRLMAGKMDELAYIEGLVKSDWLEYSESIDNILNLINRLRSWVKEKSLVLNELGKDNTTLGVDEQLTFCKFSLQKSLLEVKKEIIAELRKKKTTDISLSKHIDQLSNRRSVELYRLIKEVIEKPRRKNKKVFYYLQDKSDQEKIYGSLDMIDYVLRELGHIAPLL